MLAQRQLDSANSSHVLPNCFPVGLIVGTGCASTEEGAIGRNGQHGRGYQPQRAAREGSLRQELMVVCPLLSYLFYSPSLMIFSGGGGGS